MSVMLLRRTTVCAALVLCLLTPTSGEAQADVPDDERISLTTHALTFGRWRAAVGQPSWGTVIGYRFTHMPGSGMAFEGSVESPAGGFGTHISARLGLLLGATGRRDTVRRFFTVGPTVLTGEMGTDDSKPRLGGFLGFGVFIPTDTDGPNLRIDAAWSLVQGGDVLSLTFGIASGG